MPPATSSPNRLPLLLACIVLIAAFQYPLLINWVSSRGDNATAGEITSAVGQRGKALAALAGFSRYKQRSQNTIHEKRSKFNKLPWAQKKLTNYPHKLSLALQTVEENSLLAKDIVTFGLEAYNISAYELRAYMKMNRTAGDHSSVVQALKHYVRDWAAGGAHERDAVFPQILKAMEDRGGRVLVPGAGLGRLAYELAAQGAEVTANEFSVYVSMAYQYMMSLNGSNPRAEAGMYKFHPNVNWWSHQRDTAGLLKGVEVPDILPDEKVLKRMKMVDGDFVTMFLPQESEAFDTVVTLFFIDTARNIVAYLETIHKLLKPGGWWINLGPLLYGTNPSIELGLDEVLEVTKKLGFELLPIGEEWGTETFPDDERWAGKVRGTLAGYSWDPDNLSRNAYQAQGWIAKKL
ncbi:putative trehalase [Pyronema domesticum]|nr:putative trehalase [Pyronema domesticum]